MSGSRDKALIQEAEAQGATVCSSFKSVVNLVVAKDPNGSSSKLKKAREKEIEIVSLEDFKERLRA